jgi:hypothetical protein
MLFRLLPSSSIDQLKDNIEKMAASTERENQCAASEMIAGLVKASKHWDGELQKKSVSLSSLTHSFPI